MYSAHKTAAETISEWVSCSRRPGQWLLFKDCGDAELPPLPAGVTHVHCVGCPALRYMPPLPAGMTNLHVESCPALCSLGPLPASLVGLHIAHCPAMRCLGALPASLRWFSCRWSPSWPDVKPPAVRVEYAEDSVILWRERVRAQHAVDRRRVVASLPAAAALYV